MTNQPPPLDLREIHVLVVEDNMQNLVLMTRLLAFAGIHHYQWKSSGRQVLELADTMPRLDLVLMDLHLPHEDGYTALANLRKHPRLKNTRIVAVTANANQQEMNRAKAAGFSGFLGKPLNPDRFPDQIKAILNDVPVWDLGFNA